MTFFEHLPLKHLLDAYSDGTRKLFNLSAVVVASFNLASCVVSERPLLTDAKPILGTQFTSKLFRNFSGGSAHEQRTTSFQWRDGAYISVGDPTDFQQFIMRPLQGSDYIIQGSYPGRKLFTYWIGRKLAEGAYLIVPLNEGAVDAANRATLCAKRVPSEFCNIDTFTQLLTFANATARAPVEDAQVAVIVDDALKETRDTR